VDALDDGQLQAVLAHERAHLAGRHHLLLAAARALATTMPRIRLFTDGHRQLSRLVEMCADDAAARGHGSHALVSALLVLGGGPALPGRALAAAGTAVADRAERLMFPATPTQLRAARRRLGVALAALFVGPSLGMVIAIAGLCNAVMLL
jgi:hypothetical protein